jgi:hypothetical protein
MIFYYLNVLKIKIKYTFTFLYYDFYKICLKLYLNLFKGPNLSFSFFNTRNPLFHEILSTRSVVSPFFIFFLINKGLWYIYNLKIWLGSNLISVKPHINILRNNLRNMPLRFNRKISVVRVISYHISVLQRNFFVKFIIFLFIFELNLIYNLFYNFYFIILLSYFIMPYFYYLIFKFYIFITKFISLGIKLSMLKPLSYNLNQNSDYVGTLNNNLFLNSSSYFFSIKKIFNDYYLLFLENFKINFKINDIVLYSDNAVKGKNKIDSNNDFFKTINKFWFISKKQDQDLNKFFNNLIIKRLIFLKNKYKTYFNKLYFSRKLGLWYLSHLKLIVEIDSLYQYFYIILKKKILFLVFCLCLCLYTYFYNCFFYASMVMVYFFILFFSDYILYKSTLKFKSLFFDFYINNKVANYGLEVGLRLNDYDKLRIYNIEGFTISDYLLLLKLEINISKFEFFLNDLILEQEYFYKKKEIILNVDDLNLKRESLLLKYAILFKTHFSSFFNINENFYTKIKENNKELSLVKNNSIQYFIVLKNKITEYDDLLFLENVGNNNTIFNNTTLNFVLTDLNVNQRYYYITYGLKLLK